MEATQSAHEVRQRIRDGQWRKLTSGLRTGTHQANLVIVDHEWVDEFWGLCQKNPQALPLLERLPNGSPHPVDCAVDADVRVDLPRYRLYEDGRLVREMDRIQAQWTDACVAFLIGCSFSFERRMLREGIPVRHIERGCNVSMYTTNRRVTPSGRLQGSQVVTMRPIPTNRLDDVIALTVNQPLAHGEPIHIGDPAELGIRDLSRPDYGDPVPIQKGEVPVFWACGVTAQQVAQESKIPWMITHAPGHMFITDLAT